MEKVEEGEDKTEAVADVSQWTHHSTEAAALWSSKHPRRRGTPLPKSSSPAQSTLSSGRTILSLASNTGSICTHTCKDVNIHTHTHSQTITQRIHTDMKDLGSVETFLNPQDASRSLSCPGWYPSLFLKKQRVKSAAEALGLWWMVCWRRSQPTRGDRRKGKRGHPGRAVMGWDCGPNSWTWPGTPQIRRQRGWMETWRPHPSWAERGIRNTHYVCIRMCWSLARLDVSQRATAGPGKADVFSV